MPRAKGVRNNNYDEKRTALLSRMAVRLMRREPGRPSLRQLASAAEVTVPTLQHYFGGRREVIRAILEACHRDGELRLKALESHPGPLEDSLRDYAYALIAAVQAPRPVKLGDLFAVSLAEGLLDRAIGAATVGEILDPSVEAVRKRLDGHIARGEMIQADTRAAALMLLSPLLLAVLHQQHMGGQSCNPVDLRDLADELCAAFFRAYRVQPEGVA
jgi:AcrR family transcriptional regulator